MRTKDRLLLEEAYTQIYLKENKFSFKDEVGYVESLPKDSIEYIYKTTPKNEFVVYASNFYVRHMDRALRDRYSEYVEYAGYGEYFNINIFIKIIVRELLNLKEVTDHEIKKISNNVKSAYERRNHDKQISPDYYDSDEDSNESETRYESFIHGIQPIVEAKKKVNPWAIEKSMEKKSGKKFDKKHKEEIVKGIKKNAKKTGKKITSDKVKPKKK